MNQKARMCLARINDLPLIIKRTLMELSVSLATETKTAFERLVNERPGSSFCGFAIYTDDGARSVDIAANTQSHLTQSMEQLRNSRYQAEKYSLRWYPTEWRYEGGYAQCFPKCDAQIHEIFAEKGEEARTEVFQAMLEAMKILQNDAFFNSIADCNHFIVLVSISDSDDDEELMPRSVQELNPDSIYQQFIEEKKSAGE